MERGADREGVDPPEYARRPAVTVDRLLATVSPYKLSTWTWCQAMFFYQYVRGHWSAPTPSLAIGSAFDATVKAGYRDKRETGEDPSPDDAAARFAASFDEETERVESWSSPAERGLLLDDGVAHARHWAERTAPRVRPYDVARRFRLEVGGWTMRGEVDLTMSLEGDDVPPAWRGVYVVDHKLTAKSWTRSQAASQMQSAAYSMAAAGGLLHEDVDPSRVAYEVSVRLKRGPKRQRFLVPVGERQRAHFLHLVDTARRAWAAAYRAGAWYPNRQHWGCSRRQCPHWVRCERDHGGRVPD